MGEEGQFIPYQRPSEQHAEAGGWPGALPLQLTSLVVTRYLPLQV